MTFLTNERCIWETQNVDVDGNEYTSRCGSYAFNLHQKGIDQGCFCDAHYWQNRAEIAEDALRGTKDRK